MKKGVCVLALIMAFSLCGSACAVCQPLETVGCVQTVSKSDSPIFEIPIRYANEYLSILMSTDPARRFPTEWVLSIIESDPEHNCYSFYSSMGCTDLCCMDSEHTHWCPAHLCKNQDHGHTPVEYARAGTVDFSHD